jgi:hypothetical protein
LLAAAVAVAAEAAVVGNVAVVAAAVVGNVADTEAEASCAVEILSVVLFVAALAL